MRQMCILLVSIIVLGCDDSFDGVESVRYTELRVYYDDDIILETDFDGQQADSADVWWSVHDGLREGAEWTHLYETEAFRDELVEEADRESRRHVVRGRDGEEISVTIGGIAENWEPQELTLYSVRTPEGRRWRLDASEIEQFISKRFGLRE
jgi:hypothetical protein